MTRMSLLPLPLCGILRRKVMWRRDSQVWRCPVCVSGLWSQTCRGEDESSVLNIIPQKSCHPEPQNVTLFGTRVIADVSS